MTTWDAGARSVTPLLGDGWYEFRIPRGHTAIAGLVREDKGVDPSELSHALHWAGGAVRVVENGREVARYSFPRIFDDNETRFFIIRDGSTIHYARWYYYWDEWPPGSNFEYPAEVFHTSILPLDPGAVYLDASFMFGGEKVVNAAMTAVGEPEQEAGCDISLKPLKLAAGDLSTGVDIALLPMTLKAREGVWVNGLNLSMEYPTLSAGEVVGNGSVVIHMPPLVMHATDMVGVNGVDIRMQPLGMVMTFAEGTPRQGIRFNASIPPIGAPGVGAVYLDDYAYGAETLLTSSWLPLTDTAWAEDVLLAAQSPVVDVDDAAISTGERLEIASAIALEDVAYTSDEAFAAGANSSIDDASVCGDELLPTSIGAALMDDGARAFDAATAAAVLDVADFADTVDALALSGYALLEDAAEGWDDISIAQSNVVLLEDVAQAFDDLSLSTDATPVLLDDGALTQDFLLLKDAGAFAWVMNTDTSAVAWYTNWQFLDVATVGGKVFASGAHGLVELVGDNDDGDTIDSKVGYGFIELGGLDQHGQYNPSSQKTRVSSLWYGYESDGLLHATVETYGQGYPVQRYKMERRKAQQARNNRMQVGRGLNARYWRLGVENTKGCDFEIHSIAAEVMPSSRRL